MNNRITHTLYFILLIITMSSCSVSKQFPVTYYYQHEEDIVAMEAIYNHVAAPKPLSIGFTDKEFRHVLIEMKTDSIRYVYEFNFNDPSLFDSLHKYGYDTAATSHVLRHMKRIRCTWINTLDYYVGTQKRLLTFMSIRNRALRAPFAPEKYFILTFYSQQQYYDAKGMLLDRRNLRRIRKINNEVFRRINDKVCYTISAKFR